MNDLSRTLATILGLQAAVVAAGVHLWWGVPRLVVYLRVGSIADPRPYLFVISAFVLVGVVAALLWDVPPRRLYALGIGILLTWGLGYLWWHLTGHGGLVPDHHATDPIGTVVVHLLDDPLAFVALIAEVLGIVSFGVLFATDSFKSDHAASEADADFVPDTDG